MPAEKIVSEHKDKMEKALEVLKDELKTVRTGTASTGLVENLMVNYYETSTPLKQIATLATPQADMIIIKPFDPASINDIEKAIKNSDLSISPVLDGKMIRLSIPPLSEERRKQLAGQVKQLGEHAKVSIRNIRRDANKHLEKEQKDKTITEDELEKGKKQIDDITKDYTGKIDSIIKSKSDEIMLD
ncbi:MAG: ribosome recycling factor [Planctomycetota bacterium]|jgi:ribosome recycling factor